MVDFVNWLRENNFKGYLGEWAGGANQVCYEAITNMLNYLQENDDVMIGW